MNKQVGFLRKLDSEWKIEAKDEDVKYFYHTEETTQVLNGEKSMIIGRKGEGKTAIATFIHKNVGAGSHAEKLSFKNFPFNFIYSYTDNRFSKPSQYTTFWKYLIYASICKQMIGDSKVDSKFRNNLEKLFPQKNNRNRLKNLISRITVKEFGLQVCSTGFNIGLEKSKDELEWIDVVEILEDLVINNLPEESKYYVVFDELDEDYKDFASTDEAQNYFDLITGLFKAVNETRNIFQDEQLPVYPVVFLRSDIFQRINYSDKNKWSDYLINLEWTSEKLHRLIQSRINVLTENQSKTFHEAWEKIVMNKEVKMGNQQNSKMSSIDYILRSTHNRPRDVIKYLKEASKIALRNNCSVIGPRHIKEADASFSEYMRQEISDEIYSVLPEYNEIFSILSTIRKQTFNPKDFVEIYQEKVKHEKLIDRGAENVLKILFDFSVIGNKPSIKSKQIFKYENESSRFNFRENIIVHRGFYKALQIF
ncbi:P-loop ATPase, Sll1717 family [Streptococcus oralis]|uniref:FunZ protein n=1 Tax=Streptococcus oralis TaxID=1303 RepID=A0A4V0EBU3_STROR|nr:hypothetical protein [Streptococcus oralis]VTT05594.1 Uncharacterised protein [Streptococcus oralis]